RQVPVDPRRVEPEPTSTGRVRPPVGRPADDGLPDPRADPGTAFPGSGPGSGPPADHADPERRPVPQGAEGATAPTGRPCRPAADAGQPGGLRRSRPAGGPAVPDAGDHPGAAPATNPVADVDYVTRAISLG